jgi:hypothetical protein
MILRVRSGKFCFWLFVVCVKSAVCPFGERFCCIIQNYQKLVGVGEKVRASVEGGLNQWREILNIGGGYRNTYDGRIF